MSHDITKKVLEDIKSRDVSPLPHWRIAVGRGAWWIALMLVSALGILAAAATVFQIQRAGWPLFWHTSDWLHLAMWSLPYWWLGILTSTALLAYFAVKHLPRGYRLSVPLVAVGFFLVIGIAGWALHGLYLSGQMVDGWGRKILPFHEVMQRHHQQLWMQPEQGRLAGEVIEGAAAYMLIEDDNGTPWRVIASSTLAHFPRNARIRAVGTIVAPQASTTPAVFRAQHIEAWQDMQDMHEAMHPKSRLKEN